MKVEAEPIRSAMISVRGIVQGVGFRPFVYQLAGRHGLKGWVCNASGDVKIEVEGSDEPLSRFLNDLETQAPPRAKIDDISLDYTRPKGYRLFTIRESRPEEGKYQLLPSDIGTCRLCLGEIFDPANRRFRYPFTNCTDCGPRFTIIEDIPYDRPKTTMRPFTMCSACQGEYEDPTARRFHAQPNACPVCGPQVALIDTGGRPIVSEDPISHAADLLKDGKILAVKGLGGFLLACDATDERAVTRLRQRKTRAAKPFAVMMASISDVRRHCRLSSEEEALITSPAAPIVLLERHEIDAICPAVAPNLNHLGVMLPYTPLHHLLLADAGVPLVMTSGNLSEEPIVKDNEEALERLSPLADCLLIHNREILTRCDDSVAMVEGGKVRLIRRARGYAPSPIHLPFKVKEILACGAELKNTFCLTKDRYGFLSQHIGDMENLETLEHFERTLDLFKKLFRMDPGIVVHDRHPDYLSTQYARQLSARDSALQLVAVQHHHAHIASCMAENHARDPVIGVAFDGTGYGDDGCIWGGEFLLAHYGEYRRMAHLEYVPMPGGQVAITRPYRMAISYLYKTLGEEGLARALPFLKDARELEVNLVKIQADAGVNAPLTSSAGRLFDALSSLIGVRSHVDYEAQAAIELEMMADSEATDLPIYPFEIESGNGLRILRLGKLFEGVLADLELGITRSEISTKCHHTIAHVIHSTCLTLREEVGISRAALSGGVFQNRLLLMLTRKLLEGSGFEVYTHEELPCNDGGISLGQAVIAGFIHK